MASKYQIPRPYIDQWHRHGDFAPRPSTVPRRDGQQQDWSVEEIGHALRGVVEGGAELAFATVTPTNANGRTYPACCMWERGVKDPYQYLVMIYAGQAADFVDRGLA